MSNIKTDPNIESDYAKTNETAAYAELAALRRLVSRLYNNAYWRADRPCDEAALWESIREAIGQEPGQSPSELPYPGVRIELPLSKLRLVAAIVRRSRGGEFSSTQVEAFLSLYREELEERLNQTVRDFFQEKLG